MLVDKKKKQTKSGKCRKQKVLTEEDLIKRAIVIVDNTEIIDLTDVIKIKERKLSNVIAVIILIVCLGGLVISGYKIYEWKRDNDNTVEQINEVQENVNIEEVEDSETVEIIEPEVEVDKSNMYWDYIKMNLIDVDFTELKTKNADTKGWIQVLGTNINYPFVQTNNNDFYLNHSFDRKYNSAGWVFMDYRNILDMEERNTILYAHGRVDKTMFGSLRNILTSGWLMWPENYVVRLSTEYENTLWQVFSVYHIPATNDYIQIKFATDTKYIEFLNMLKDRSSYNFDTEVSANDRILTLSTCYDLTDRVVLHAKLIKRELK